jgi:hypothetical protein
MAFQTYAATTSAKANQESTVDWAELNNYVVETCNLQERETLVGYISGIVDLGTQKMPDAEYPFEGDEDEEAAEIEKDSSVYFKDGYDPDTRKPCRMKCKPQRDQQAVAIAVDFPEIMLNKGKFFGDEEAGEKPLRIWMGNSFFMKDHGMIIGRPTPLRITNLDKTRKTKKWSFAKNHLFYKMALAAKLIKNDDCFLPNDIDKLVGEAFQFSVQVYFKKAKDGKDYYTEYIGFVGGLGRGQAKPEVVTEPFLIQFMEKNNEVALKELRNHVINTMKMARNWEGSVVKKQLEALKPSESTSNEGSDTTEGEDTPPAEKSPAKASKPASKGKPKVEEPEDDDLDSCPF